MTQERAYLLSLYFTITTVATVGLGDITPKTTGEKVYVCIFILFGVWVYTNTISLFSTVDHESR